MELIVVVSRTSAKIFEQERNGALKIVDTVSNPEGRSRNIELVTDSLVNDSHEEVAIRFMKKVGRNLKKKLVANEELLLKIVADAKLTGRLREEFSNRELLHIEWIQKNVEKVPQVQWPKLLKINKVKRQPNAIIRLRT